MLRASSLPFRVIVIAVFAQTGCGGSDAASVSGQGPAERTSDAGTARGDAASTRHEAGEPPRGELRLFITSEKFTGNLGGLAGADAKCEDAAARATLGGRWIALLSDRGKDAVARPTSDGPWREVGTTREPDGAPKVLPSRTALSKEGLPLIDRNEYGERVVEPFAWSGTGGGGVRGEETCSSWTDDSAGAKGRVADFVSAFWWTTWGGAPLLEACERSLALTCLEEP